jgi:hypothetical protein
VAAEAPAPAGLAGHPGVEEGDQSDDLACRLQPGRHLVSEQAAETVTAEEVRAGRLGRPDPLGVVVGHLLQAGVEDRGGRGLHRLDADD